MCPFSYNMTNRFYPSSFKHSLAFHFLVGSCTAAFNAYRHATPNHPYQHLPLPTPPAILHPPSSLQYAQLLTPSPVRHHTPSYTPPNTTSQSVAQPAYPPSTPKSNPYSTQSPLSDTETPLIPRMRPWCGVRVRWDFCFPVPRCDMMSGWRTESVRDVKSEQTVDKWNPL